VLGVLAVREVQARDVHPRFDEPRIASRVSTAGPHGADDLGAASNH
jgi:hypothetical protein